MRHAINLPLFGPLADPATVVEIGRAVDALDAATTPAELMVPEAAGANAYWSAWAPLEMRWARADLRRVPEHWRTFGGRASPLTGNPRMAANPANSTQAPRSPCR